MRAAVVGGGLQGCCIALELTARGVPVDLYERNPRLMDEASSHNEGKVHLGYVYAQDRSFRTARLMIRGALAFEPLLRRWLGDAVDRIPVSTPFDYVVHRKSLIGPEGFEHHASRAAETARELLDGGPVSYFGCDPTRAMEPLSPSQMTDRYAGDVVAAYRTEEIAIDSTVLADIVRARVATEPQVTALLGRPVTAVTETADGVILRSGDPSAAGEYGYDVVFNAARAHAWNSPAERWRRR